MTLALIAGALLTAAAVWFLARPLGRAGGRALPAENREDLAQLRDRLLAQLRELEVESGDGNIDAAVATDERRRLESELAQVLKRLDADTDAGAPEGAGTRGSRVAPVIALAVFLPLAAAGLYFAGNAGSLAQLAELRGLPSDGSVPPMALQMVSRLERRLAEAPDDPEAWALLGRSYSVLGRPADAREAYRRALALAPENIEIKSAYAGFLLSLDPAQPPPEAVALFREIQAKDPDNPSALWALGLVAYYEQDFAQAAANWERLLELLPPDNPEVEAEIRHALSEARARAQSSN